VRFSRLASLRSLGPRPRCCSAVAAPWFRAFRGCICVFGLGVGWHERFLSSLGLCRRLWLQVVGSSCVSACMCLPFGRSLAFDIACRAESMVRTLCALCVCFTIWPSAFAFVYSVRVLPFVCMLRFVCMLCSSVCSVCLCALVLHVCYVCLFGALSLFVPQCLDFQVFSRW